MARQPPQDDRGRGRGDEETLHGQVDSSRLTERLAHQRAGQLDLRGEAFAGAKAKAQSGRNPGGEETVGQVSQQEYICLRQQKGELEIQVKNSRLRNGVDEERSSKKLINFMKSNWPDALRQFV